MKTEGPRTAVLLQDACYSHRYIRSTDLSAIVERPERLRALKVGLAGGIARIEEISRSGLHVFGSPGDNLDREDRKPRPETQMKQEDDTDLTSALQKLTLAASPSRELTTTVVDIIHSTASASLASHPAAQFIHGDDPSDQILPSYSGGEYVEKLIKLSRESEDAVRKGESEIPIGLSQGDLYLCPGSLEAIQGALGTVCEAIDTVVRASRHKPSSPSETIPLGEPSSISQAPPAHAAPVERSDVPQTTEPSSSDYASHATRAFVAIRPPGHHCGDDTPSGFCFVNNVAVAAAHAYLTHGITRIAILDIDLHHGNGTQAIAWRINEETYRAELEAAARFASEGDVKPETNEQKKRLRIFYGSLHDVLSYPCEDGDPLLVQAASVVLRGAHGQHVENIHLAPYTSAEDFWNTLYPGPYSQLLRSAEAFLTGDGSTPDDCLVLISCGFDASEHEHASMSRHGRNVPTAFFHAFARDARRLADRCANERLVSVLEGGYSDRALVSGAMAHLMGLVGELDREDRALKVEGKENEGVERWWDVKKLEMLENATKKRRGGRPSNSGPSSQSNEDAQWLERSLAILNAIDPPGARTPPRSRAVPLGKTTPSMVLRERKAGATGVEGTGISASASSGSVGSASGGSNRGRGKGTPRGTPRGKGAAQVQGRTDGSAQDESVSVDGGLMKNITLGSEPRTGGYGESNGGMTAAAAVDVPKKLPRVVLRVKDPDVTS
ncbi:Arginase/deacetylase [Rickenella mellea]|uniref:Arginase/deacetylase n=1 Tax=Rickenella mellea TaxID=50990 RepID=A0A4Y7PRU6_9AGAM|nr:Arginase/deacetylase [Rickenella mellea]